MKPRVIYDTSVILNSMTPVPQQGSLSWEWMTSETLEVITSRYLINRLMNNLANPRFRLDRPAQRRIIADYLKHASLYVDVPESGAYCRDIKDIPILDLAIWQQVDSIVTTDPDLLELDGEYSFRIVRPAGMFAAIASEGTEAHARRFGPNNAPSRDAG